MPDTAPAKSPMAVMSELVLLEAVTPGPTITEVEPVLELLLELVLPELVLPGPRVVPGPITLVEEEPPPGPAALPEDEPEEPVPLELPVPVERLATLPSMTVPPSITLPSIGTIASPARKVPATNFSSPALVCLEGS